jgi:two-component system phosphate regulon sensor histidine kinase PhoR
MVMQNKHVIVVTADPQINFLLERILNSMALQPTVFQEFSQARTSIENRVPALVILADTVGSESGLDFCGEIHQRLPGLPVLIIITTTETPALVRSALKHGAVDIIPLPLRTEDFIKVLQDCLEKADLQREWILRETRRDTSTLERKLDEMETLARLARSINSSLNLNSVLTAIVDAAVSLSGTEEGSLLLLDEATGELYMRAARNFQEEFVRTFRIPMKDSLAGSVLTSGKPVLLDKNTPQKIKTSYLVQSLIYVPLELNGHVFGVLGVDNRGPKPPLGQRDVKMLTALAEVAVIAIQNARLYERLMEKSNQLDSIINHIQDGVIVIDLEHRLMLVNQVAIAAFQLSERSLIGQKFSEVFSQPELVELVDLPVQNISMQMELTAPDGRVFSTYINSIPNLGIAITMHDVSHLKKLDRIKSDFVSTVSHDLRSPLTAILGYAVLLNRVGPINDTQQEFLQRIQTSVQNITILVNDLLNLGKIEAGLDIRKESVFVDQLLNYVVENLAARLQSKGLGLKLELQLPFEPIFANTVQIRQLLDNLLDNAIKYTPKSGVVTVSGGMDNHQLILHVSDTGAGIPSAELPFIFDKFFRASNVSGEESGTGLGLAIVKSIVENHQGRIWVDSTLGKGTTFTVVLPQAEE